MSQIFKPSTNTLARVSLFGAIFFIVASLWVIAELNRSAWATREGVIRKQPIPFSHDHHVAAMGIECLYCHTSVEDSAFAGAREFIFSSGVLRDVVYEGILGRQRRAYHALVARWLIERSGDRADDFAGLNSSHLEQARELE